MEENLGTDIGGGQSQTEASASVSAPVSAAAVHELRQCRHNIATGNLPHAAFHLGQAIAHDPAFLAAYAALDEFVEAAGSPEAARELFRGDGTGVFIGNAAANISLLAKEEGKLSSAVELLASVVAVDPVKPWTAAPWFSAGLDASAIPDISIGRAVRTVWRAVSNPAPAEIAVALAPWLELARTVAARPDPDPEVLGTLSALARRLGAHEDALAWCRAAEQSDIRASGAAKAHTLVMLGYAYQDAGQKAQAIGVWERAAALQPDNADLFLDLADTTFDLGEFARSQRWAERAVAIDGSALKPQAALRAARFRASKQGREIGDLAPLIELADLARAHPEVDYLRNRLSHACEKASWLRVMPVPTEAVAETSRRLTAIVESGEGRVSGMRGIATDLEAPSAISALRSQMPGYSLEVPHIAAPDMRIPVNTDFGPPLWTYRGTEAVPTVGPPSPEAVERLYQVAAGVWADPLVAYDQAAGFAGLDGADLLGLLAYVPPARLESWKLAEREFPLYWHRIAQVWVCIGILHHRPDEPWAQSTRRTLLLRLLFGSEDWTVDAAAFALCVQAWQFPEQRPEISGAITQRCLHAAKAIGRRPTQLHDPLARVLLICPGVDPKVTRLVRKALAERQEETLSTEDADQLKDRLQRLWKRRNRD